MPKANLPKIKLGTARQIAKNLVTDKYGHQVSETRLKKFMQQDKDLRKFAYKGDAASMTKFQAKKFFNKVVDNAKTTGAFKMSRLAKKMGITETRPRVSDIALNKVYGQASQTEYDATPHDTGPTLEEQSRARRREKMMKTLHKRERAEEVQREEQQQGKDAPDSGEQKSSIAPPPRAGSGSIPSTIGAPPPNQAASPGSVPRPSQKTVQLGCLIFPVENQTPHIPGFDLVAQKISNFITQRLTSARLFPVLSSGALWDALHQMRLDTIPASHDTDARRHVAERAGATLFVGSTISQSGQFTELSSILYNTRTGTTIKLAYLKEPLNDQFSFERKIGWQIDAALSSQSDDNATPPPSSADAVELPI
ncbi:MAG: hypothetical protein ACOYUK_00635 [Patescibacteria group bacterium]